MNRVRNTKLVLWLITGLAAAVVLNRLIFGLGITTNLDDATPWGIWIGFKLGLVALAAGGFVVTAIYYIIKREEFHPLVKPAVLIGFLGYISFVSSLIFDLGLPWNIWHMIIYWNPRSPLFEVGWCVMIYTTVLLLEFSPVPLEKYSRYAKARNFLMKYRFILVLLGIMLSTLHQSSLGTLFMIMPFRLYPLWYSHILPVQFFISAIAMGITMVAFAELTVSWLYRRRPQSNLIEKLLSLASWVLVLYFIVKMADIIYSGSFGIIFNGKWESNLFIFEVLTSIIIPAILFLIPQLRKKKLVQWLGPLILVNGIALNRINVAGLAMSDSTGNSYTPMWTEVVLSLGIVSTAALVFLFIIENFHVWDGLLTKTEKNFTNSYPHLYTLNGWKGIPDNLNIRFHSLAFILSFAAGMFLMSGNHLHSGGVDNIKVRRATGIDTLIINGNRDDQFVIFPHQAHIERLGKDKCNLCHHFKLPDYKLNNCSDCHTSMYKPVDFFNHDWHTSVKGGNLKCNECHKAGETRSIQSAKSCDACHQNYKFALGEKATSKYFIPSYTDAMHRMCLTCHEKEQRKPQVKVLNNKRDLLNCSTCHSIQFPNNRKENLNKELNVNVQHFNNVILPK